MVFTAGIISFVSRKKQPVNIRATRTTAVRIAAAVMAMLTKLTVLADLTDLALVLIVLFIMQPPNGAEQGGQGRIPRPTEIIERA